jgi:uncharacterized damage-inducible protein DinB
MPPVPAPGRKATNMDSHHRGQVSMLARQLGHPVPAKTGFGLGERGTLCRERGFGR